MPHTFENSPEDEENCSKSRFERIQMNPNDRFLDKRFWIGFLVGTLVSMLVVLILGYLTIATFSRGLTQPLTVQNQPSTPISSRKPSSSPVKLSWTGKGSKTTDQFTIGSGSWRICWSTKPNPNMGGIPGNFVIFIYDGAGNMISGAANVIGTDNDCTVMHVSGTFYLDITATQLWELRIESD